MVRGVAGAFRLHRRFGVCEIRCYAGKCWSHLKYIYNVINIIDGWQSDIRPTWVGLGDVYKRQEQDQEGHLARVKARRGGSRA